MAILKMTLAASWKPNRGGDEQIVGSWRSWIKGRSGCWGIEGEVQFHSVLTKPERPVGGCIHHLKLKTRGKNLGVFSI